MPLAPRRAARRGVVGPAPVARTAAVVGTAAVVAHGVDRRSDRRSRPFSYCRNTTRAAPFRYIQSQADASVPNKQAFLWL